MFFSQQAVHQGQSSPGHSSALAAGQAAGTAGPPVPVPGMANLGLAQQQHMMSQMMPGLVSMPGAGHFQYPRGPKPPAMVLPNGQFGLPTGTLDQLLFKKGSKHRQSSGQSLISPVKGQGQGQDPDVFAAKVHVYQHLFVSSLQDAVELLARVHPHMWHPGQTGIRTMDDLVASYIVGFSKFPTCKVEPRCKSTWMTSLSLAYANSARPLESFGADWPRLHTVAVKLLQEHRAKLAKQAEERATAEAEAFSQRLAAAEAQQQRFMMSQYSTAPAWMQGQMMANMPMGVPPQATLSQGSGLGQGAAIPAYSAALTEASGAGPFGQAIPGSVAAVADSAVTVEQTPDGRRYLKAMDKSRFLKRTASDWAITPKRQHVQSLKLGQKAHIIDVLAGNKANTEWPEESDSSSSSPSSPLPVVQEEELEDGCNSVDAGHIFDNELEHRAQLENVIQSQSAELETLRRQLYEQQQQFNWHGMDEEKAFPREWDMEGHGQPRTPLGPGDVQAGPLGIPAPSTPGGSAIPAPSTPLPDKTAADAAASLEGTARPTTAEPEQKRDGNEDETETSKKAEEEPAVEGDKKNQDKKRAKEAKANDKKENKTAKDKKDDKVGKQDKKVKKHNKDNQDGKEPKTAEPKAAQRQTSLFGRGSKGQA